MPFGLIRKNTELQDSCLSTNFITAHTVTTVQSVLRTALELRHSPDTPKAFVCAVYHCVLTKFLTVHTITTVQSDTADPPGVATQP